MSRPLSDPWRPGAPPAPDPWRAAWPRVLATALGLALAAYAAAATGLDGWLAERFYDAARKGFPARDWPMLELIGHRLAKDLIVALEVGLVVLAVLAPRIRPLAPHRALLWTTALAMVAGPLVVVVLKSITAAPCPYDLARFGGHAVVPETFFVRPADAGRCFPSGHAAGGFSLFALYFAGIALGNARLRAVGLGLALAAGSAYGAVRMVQGAHFLSHNLWSAFVDWTMAALVFAPLLRARRAPPRGSRP